MLDAVYVDTIEGKAIVAIRPKPAIIPLFDVDTTRECSGIVLISEKELPPGDESNPEASTIPCLWRRWGRVELYLKHGLVVLVAANWLQLDRKWSVQFVSAGTK